MHETVSYLLLTRFYLLFFGNHFFKVYLTLEKKWEVYILQNRFRYCNYQYEKSKTVKDISFKQPKWTSFLIRLSVIGNDWTVKTEGTIDSRNISKQNLSKIRNFFTLTVEDHRKSHQSTDSNYVSNRNDILQWEDDKYSNFIRTESESLIFESKPGVFPLE